MFPERLKRGRTHHERAHSVLDVAERYLRVDKSSGEQAHVHVQGNVGKIFAARDRDALIKFPIDHPRAGQPRYRWSDGEIQLGYLIDD